MYTMNRRKLFYFILVCVSFVLVFVAKKLSLDILFEIHLKVHVLSDNRSVRFQPGTALSWGRIFKPPPTWAGRENLTVSDTFPGEKNLSRSDRVLFLVMTMAGNLQTKALAVKETWGKRCDVLIFFSSETNETFPAVGLGTPEGRHHLTAKTMAAFRYVYENYLDEADWFMKADDDTYVIVENLRLFLHDKNSSEPIYYGHLFKKFVPQGYYSGGGGYVISKEALRRFGTYAVHSDLCPQDGGAEDLNWGLCMKNLGMVTSPSLDSEEGTVFHAVQASAAVLERSPAWLWRYSARSPQRASDVSRHAVSFHYTSPDQMRMMEFFLYHLKVKDQ